MQPFPNGVIRNVMRIAEIYRSIQGESSYAGRPCTFVRTAGCSLRCRYCDTGYALSFQAGEDMLRSDVLQRVRELGIDLVELTGGEPLEEPETPALCAELLAEGATVLIETSGAFPIVTLPPGVISIMDLKTPSSGMQDRNLWDNISHLHSADEVKFVIGTREDFDWSVTVCREHGLFERCGTLFSPTFGKIEPLQLVEWMLAESIPARFQLQMHKYVWPPTQKGV